MRVGGKPGGSKGSAPSPSTNGQANKRKMKDTSHLNPSSAKKIKGLIFAFSVLVDFMNHSFFTQKFGCLIELLLVLLSDVLVFLFFKFLFLGGGAAVTFDVDDDDDIAVEEIVMNGEPIMGNEEFFNPAALCTIQLTEDRKGTK